jgi:hypothetical protein
MQKQARRNTSPVISVFAVYIILRNRKQMKMGADSPDAFLIADDSVQDKRYSRFVELVRLQHSGTEPGLVRDIGVVNLVHSSGKPGEFYPIDYRIYDPEANGKSKNDHLRDMLLHAVADKTTCAGKSENCIAASNN